MSVLSAQTLETADGYWAADLGCRRNELRPGEPKLRAHAGGLDGYLGAFALVVEDAAPVVSLPPGLASRLSEKASLFTAAAIANPDDLRRLLGPTEVERVIGPAELLYADAGCFTPPPRGGTRELVQADEAEVEAFRQACDPADWDPKGFDLSGRRTFGALGARGELLAVADFEVWSERIAHLSVVTHPSARGQGHGLRAVAVAAVGGLDSGLVLQYRALRTNHRSLRVGANLGFQKYGWSIAARFVACDV